MQDLVFENQPNWMTTFLDLAGRREWHQLTHWALEPDNRRHAVRALIMALSCDEPDCLLALLRADYGSNDQRLHALRSTANARASFMSPACVHAMLDVLPRASASELVFVALSKIPAAWPVESALSKGFRVRAEMLDLATHYVAGSNVDGLRALTRAAPLGTSHEWLRHALLEGNLPAARALIEGGARPSITWEPTARSDGFTEIADLLKTATPINPMPPLSARPSETVFAIH